MTAPSTKTAMYSERIRTSLLPARLAVEQRLAMIEYERAEYADLAERLDKLSKKEGAAESTMMELGEGVWVDAVMPSTSKVVIDLGFDIHVELAVGEAAAYATKRCKILETRRGLMEQRSAQITWQIEQFEGAIVEAQTATS